MKIRDISGKILFETTNQVVLGVGDIKIAMFPEGLENLLKIALKDSDYGKPDSKEIPIEPKPQI